MADFYRDMPRWAFHSQVFFLSQRLQHHQSLLQRPTSVIQDRSVYEDAEIFARNLYQQGHMSDREWKAYGALYRTLSLLLRPPDLIVYLAASVHTLVRRISQRGRDYEKTISEDYLVQLNELYNQWVSQTTICPVLTIETDNLDPVYDDEHLDVVVQKMLGRLHGKDYISFGSTRP